MQMAVARTVADRGRVTGKNEYSIKQNFAPSLCFGSLHGSGHQWTHFVRRLFDLFVV